MKTNTGTDNLSHSLNPKKTYSAKKVISSRLFLRRTSSFPPSYINEM